MKLLMQEDDCAPDAREYFVKKMKERFNLTFKDFFDFGEYVEIDDLCCQRHSNAFIF